jgi:predicted RNA-binding Zn-ribbon protein involved in translation (DUF1610 family)
MGDVIQFTVGAWHERGCSNCGSQVFIWFTNRDDDNQHIFECDDCGTEHAIYGEEVTNEH